MHEYDEPTHRIPTWRKNLLNKKNQNLNFSENSINLTLKFEDQNLKKINVLPEDMNQYLIPKSNKEEEIRDENFSPTKKNSFNKKKSVNIVNIDQDVSAVSLFLNKKSLK